MTLLQRIMFYAGWAFDAAIFGCALFLLCLYCGGWALRQRDEKGEAE